MKFCIFGLQRSGTTVVEKTPTNNFICEVANGKNWKHSLSKVSTGFITFNVYKNPYTWIESIVFRDPADILVVHSHLLDPGYNIGHDNVNLPNLAKMYNDYALSWFDEQTMVRYENLINPATLTEFLNKVPFERKTKTVTLPEPGSLFMPEGFSNDIIPYYLEEKPTQLTQEHIRVINENISDEVFSKLGYKRIDI